MTGETITSVEELRTHLASVRESGLALEQEEALLGENGLAAPVFDGDVGVVGSFGIVVPSGSWPVDAGTRDAVRDAARAISRELGATRWPLPE
jgi:DNA-binding IclR family transcriptional regulator